MNGLPKRFLSREDQPRIREGYGVQAEARWKPLRDAGVPTLGVLRVTERRSLRAQERRSPRLGDAVG